MGNFKSHLSKEDDMDTTNPPSTPLPEGLAKSKHLALLDPRSPTIGVSRTPVEIAAERERTRQEREKKLKTLGLSNKNDEVSTPPAFIDPRSPAFDYIRTPIAFDEGDSTNQQTTEKGRDNELQVPLPNPVSRDLRKRLFVSQINDSLNASGVQLEDNKEN